MALIISNACKGKVLLVLFFLRAITREDASHIVSYGNDMPTPIAKLFSEDAGSMFLAYSALTTMCLMGR